MTDDALLLSLEAGSSGSDATAAAKRRGAPASLSAHTLARVQTLPENSTRRPDTEDPLPMNLETAGGYDIHHHDHVDGAEVGFHSGTPGPEAESALLPDARDAATDLSETDLRHSHTEFDAHDTYTVDIGAAQTLDASLDATDGAYYDLPFSLGLALSHGPEQVAAISPWTEPKYPLDEAETLDVLQSFITNSATWCETTDSNKNFSAAFIHDIAAHKVCMAAALALTCRHRSVFDRSYNETALQQYQYTIQLLIRQDPDHTDPFVLTACILLCVYEMISADVADWRRHLKVSHS